MPTMLRAPVADSCLRLRVPGVGVGARSRQAHHPICPCRVEDSGRPVQQRSRAVVQTNDGYLWVGTDAGLLRFDGVRFVPWSPGDGQRLPSSQIYTLLAASDGSLWIATVAGLSRWKNSDADATFRPGLGASLQSSKTARGPSGSDERTRPAGSGPLCQVVEAGNPVFGRRGRVPCVRRPWRRCSRIGSAVCGLAAAQPCCAGRAARPPCTASVD